MAVIKFLEEKKNRIFSQEKNNHDTSLFTQNIGQTDRFFWEQVVIVPCYTLLHCIQGERAMWLIITTLLCCQVPKLYSLWSAMLFILSPNNLRAGVSPSWPSFDRSENPDQARLLLNWRSFRWASAGPGSALLGAELSEWDFYGILIARRWPESSAPVLAFCFSREYSLRTHISWKKKSQQQTQH